jgi:pimeloyl-ACP methyl ester carboxylesterase
MVKDDSRVLTTETKTLKNGKKLRLAMQGNGSTLVFLHGYPENLHIWAPLVSELSASNQCLAFDWPGMGESEEWNGGAAPKHMALRLAQIMDELQLGKVSLVACDMGGQAALELPWIFLTD